MSKDTSFASNCEVSPTNVASQTRASATPVKWYQATPSRSSHAPRPGSMTPTPFCNRFRSRSTKELRQLDKPFCQQVIKNLCVLLEELKFAKIVDPKKFYQNPASKDFVQMCQFLYSQIDAIGASEWNKKNGEDVADLAKELRYPVPVAKSALKAVGAPTTWPQLIGLIDWLANLGMWACRGTQKRLERALAAMPEYQEATEMYEIYMKGNDEAVEKRIHERIVARKEELAQKRERLEALRAQTDKLKVKFQNASEQIRLPEILENLETRLAEIPKRQLYIDSKKLHLKRQRDEIAHLNAQSSSMKARKERGRKELSALHNQIAQQPYTIEEENRMLAEVDEVNKQIKELRQEETDARAAYRKLDERVSLLDEKHAKIKDLKASTVENGGRLHDARKAVVSAVAEVNARIDTQQTRIAELKRIVEDNVAERDRLTKAVCEAKEEVALCNEQYVAYASAPCLPLLEDVSSSPLARTEKRKEEVEEKRRRLRSELQDIEMEREEAKQQEKLRVRELLDLVRAKKTYFDRLALQIIGGAKVG